MDALSRGGGEGREVCYGNLFKDASPQPSNIVPGCI